jgi:endonuclease YncB( thermonuclease family)
MTKLRLAIAAAVLVAAAGSGHAFGQESRPHDAKAAKEVHWTLVPPLEGVPCPSHVPGPEAPKELTFGTFKLAKPAAVVDGDTIRVEGLKDSLRFIGLDAEETFKKEDAEKRKKAEADWKEYVLEQTKGCDPARPPKYATFMGEAAKSGMKQLLEGVSEVCLEWDEEQRKVDGYGRNLVLVLFQKDGKWINLNVEMVRQGLSPYFVKYGRARRSDDRFVAAQKEAQAHERGIWQNPGRIPHYEDYAKRLAWWTERADLIVLAEKLRKERDDFMILGRDDDWQRLKAMAGKQVTVFGTPIAPIRKNDLVLIPLLHRKGLDFMIAASEADLARLDPKKEDGNLIFVTGVVELYKDQPQFRAKTTSWSRTLPRGAESAPAAR